MVRKTGMKMEMEEKGSDWWGDKIRETWEEGEKISHRKRDVRGGTESNALMGRERGVKMVKVT